MSTELNFDELYTQNFRPVKMVCKRFVRDDSLAEDLAQETFIQVFKNLHLFRGDCKVTTWMHRIAVTQSLMYLRKRRLDAVGLDHEDLRNLRAVVSNPNDTVLLESVISKLATGYRTVFLLRNVEGFTFPEIARMMDFSEGTGKSQDHKAKARLRQLLG